MEQFNSIIFTKPQFNDQPSAWIENIPFAFFLVEKLRPKTYVELGTQFGNSYFAFCQAISELKLPSNAFGVDIWLSNGDDKFTGERIFEYADMINSKHFSHFSNLLLMTFDEALDYFNSFTIDLLHIDGMHDYASVKHDFESWLPKMSEAGVIIFHDSNVRENGFGVWKLVEEISGRYPNFSFNFGKGLTVVCTGKNVPESFLQFVKNAGEDPFTHQLFSALGSRWLLKNQMGLYLNQTNETLNVLRDRISQLEDRLRIKESELEVLKAEAAHAARVSKSTFLNKILSFVKRRRNDYMIWSNTIKIANSGLFDTEFYLHHNPDVKNSGMDPAKHYLLFGGSEGRNPSEKFNSTAYLNQNPNIKVLGINPLLHFLSTGQDK